MSGSDKPYKDESWLREQYVKNDKTVEEIGEECDVDQRTITRWLNNHGIEIQQGRKAADTVSGAGIDNVRDEEWLDEKYNDEDWSMTKIADETGVSTTTVSNYIDKYNLKETKDTRYKDEPWLREQYKENGKRAAEIADECGVSERTITSWLGRHDIETNPSKRASETVAEGDIDSLKDEEWLRREYKEKSRSMLDIADELGVHQLTVEKHLVQHDIEKHSRSVAISEGDIERLKDGEWLREKYETEEKDISEIAEMLGVSVKVVRQAIADHDIDKRTISEELSEGDVEKLFDEGWLRDQYQEQDKSSNQIGSELGVTHDTVTTWLRNHDIPVEDRRDATSDGDWEQLRDEEWLRDQYENKEKNTFEIGDELGLHYTTVLRQLSKHEIETRTYGEYHNPDHLDHITRSGWELEIADLLHNNDVEYGYESEVYEYHYDGEVYSYAPDFIVGKYVIEVKGVVFREEKMIQKAKALIEQSNLVFVLVADENMVEEIPSDVFIDWGERERLLDVVG